MVKFLASRQRNLQGTLKSLKNMVPESSKPLTARKDQRGHAKLKTPWNPPQTKYEVPLQNPKGSVYMILLEVLHPTRKYWMYSRTCSVPYCPPPRLNITPGCIQLVSELIRRILSNRLGPKGSPRIPNDS